MCVFRYKADIVGYSKEKEKENLSQAIEVSFKTVFFTFNEFSCTRKRY